MLLIHKLNTRLFVATLSFLPQLAFASELITNGGFEQSQKAWQVHPHMQLSLNNEKHNNTSLLSKSIPAPDDGYIHIIKTTQCINIDPTIKKLNFTADFFYIEKPMQGHAHRVNFIWYDTKDCMSGAQAGVFLQPKLIDGWQQLNQSAITPALNSQSVSIELIQDRRASFRDFTVLETIYYWFKSLFGDGSERLSSGFWDNISLTKKTDLKPDNRTHSSNKALSGSYAKNSSTHNKLTKNTNLLLNSSFAQNAKHWSLSSRVDWHPDIGNLSAGSIRSSLTSKKNSAGSTIFSQCINTHSHSTFKFGGFFQREPNSSQTGGGRIRVIWYGGENCTEQSKIGRKHTSPKRIDGWQHLSVASITSPKNVRSVKIQGVQSIDGKGEFIAYWDDLYLIAE